MATLEDKLLGEKLQYYCSSSEDEDEGKKGHSSDQDHDESGTSATAAPVKNKLKFIPEADIREWEGNSTNTGPKGVIRDWQRFKQLESEKRQQQEQERIVLAKKLSATCRSHLDDEKEKQKKEQGKLPPVVDSVDSDDEVLQEYLQKRMKELMQSRKQSCCVYGRVFELDSVDAFLDCTEKTSKTTLVLILLHEDRTPGCASMKNAVQYLAAEYAEVKFCQIKSSILKVSNKFKSMGLPALQAYRNGELIGNYVQLVKEFGEEIYGSDVESFLIEHGILQDRTLVPAILRSSKQSSSKDDDSD